ncbi:pyrrolo-quinoline quinone [Skermanella stibiiresistens SB22]|uniref:Pyrrolo-quinoline quinone n=1 Tax=Skermanella stibiiresistens SB22 TaxID=1385369 RepID=W9H1P2_9PROT|nr:PQQ-binding-like beta-propeller repeat protein [Skermanella stibiiresistens]EWY40004.1 pyrrolo-quinoline quinone [Skermanella stibiiresistens SB22]
MTPDRATSDRASSPRNAIGCGPAVRLMAAGMVTLSLAGCGSGSWFGDSEPPPIPGERISVLRLERQLEPDPRLADLRVELPAATTNPAWPQAGGNPDHAMGNLALAPRIRQVWTADIGYGSSTETRLLAQPVVAQGRVYTLDTEYDLTAFDASTGKQVWQTSVERENESGGALGGGAAFADNRLMVTTGYGELLSVDPATGAISWRTRVPGPVRSAPSIVNGRVFVITVDNQLIAYSANDGATLWTHTGILETAGLLGAASPAVDGTIVAAPYSSGELFALRAENGRVAWSDNLAAARRVGALSNLADIRGMPVIDRGLVLAVSHSGRMVAIDERTGGRAWEQEIGGVDTPAVAGDFIFVLSNDNEVIALTRQAGRVRWVAPLARYEDPADRQGPIIWTGPTLAGGQLWLANSTGELVALSPEDGRETQRLDLPGSTFIPPVVADGTLYVLTDDGTLAAYR